MNTKNLMVALVAVLAVFALGFISASIDVSIETDNDAGVVRYVGDTFPIRATFNSEEDLRDVEVVVIFDGKIESYFQGSIYANKAYQTSIINVKVPSKISSDRSMNMDLTIEVYGYDCNNTKVKKSEDFSFTLQRKPFDLTILSVDYSSAVSAGESIPVSVVIKNRGFENSEDAFVSVSVPELGISAKGYLGDLVAIDDACVSEFCPTCNNYCNDDKTDAAQKILTLKIPSNAKDGTYELIVKVYDEDSVKTVSKQIVVSASTDSQLVSVARSQNIKAGETKTFDLILVNSGNGVTVYDLSASYGSELSVSVPSVVVVDKDTSKTVPITVSVASDAKEGDYPFTVKANGQTLTFNASVAKSNHKAADFSAIAMTAILVVIFVALLAVLIILLTRKSSSKQVEEVETSYY